MFYNFKNSSDNNSENDFIPEDDNTTAGDPESSDEEMNRAKRQEIQFSNICRHYHLHTLIRTVWVISIPE